MMRIINRVSAVLATAIVLVSCCGAARCAGGEIDWKKNTGRWSAARAKEWYDGQPWIVGANFLPSTASNQFEMWQEDTFDPETIDRELGWAAAAGYNTMRVFLHDMLWASDPDGFTKRIDKYLEIASKHGIRTMFVLFDSCWDPRPKLGPQEPPMPGVHNSRWLQSPHIDVLKDPSKYDTLKPYVTGILKRYKDDPRVLAWDLLNEPGNRAGEPGRDEGWTTEQKSAAHAVLLGKLFAWAREVSPSQPLTVCVWRNYGITITYPVDPLVKIAIEQSDVITFHNYTTLQMLSSSVSWLRKTGRPLICSEYMARTEGSTFQAIMPFFKKMKIGAMNWGLVSGRSQTIYPWSSWRKPFDSEPSPWFHDVFRQDGTSYDEAEVALIRELSGKK